MKMGHNWMGKKTKKPWKTFKEQSLILGRLLYLSPKQMGMFWVKKMNYD